MSDIIDRIDELVDEQLADGEPENGYDFGDPDYPTCPHCSRHWHGLRITLNIERMRLARQFDPDYSYADDDSPVLCEGSEFIGPIRPPARLSRVIHIRIVPDFERFALWFQQVRERFESFLGTIPGAPWIAYTEHCDEPKQPGPLPTGITIRFGPENWIHEIRRIPPERQFPRPYPRLFVSPAEWEIHAHWTQFTAPNYPIPHRPGYDFSRYAHDDQEPIWAPRADTRQRATARPAHTHVRHRTRGRTRR